MSALGRGLQSLIPKKSVGQKAAGDVVDVPQETPREIPTAKITANPLQPRSTVSRVALEELMTSIREHGILQPLIVAKAEGGYQLIAGERRLQSAKMLGLPRVPVIIRDATRQQQLEIALVENLQRQDLNSLDAAAAYQRLIDEFNLTQEQVARRIGKSRETVANTLRLLQLPPDLQKWVREGKLTEGHAKVLLGERDPKVQRQLAQKMIGERLSVQTAATLTRKAKRGRRGTPADPAIIDYESRLQERLGTRVRIARRAHRGEIAIAFYSDDELDSLVNHLTS